MLEDGIKIYLALLRMSASPFSLEENVIVRGPHLMSATVLDKA